MRNSKLGLDDLVSRRKTGREILARRYIASLALGSLLGVAVGSVASGQAPTPTPTGEFLCSAGPRDGQACATDDDCAPGGACVIGQGVCNGGTDDGFPCDCSAGTCLSTPVCSIDATFGTCSGGPNIAQCCDPTTNCADGVPCVGTPKVCLAGIDKGFSCLNDGQCPGSVCQSTGKFCCGGDFDSFSCVDDTDCNVAGSLGGTCDVAGSSCVIAPTPTPTPTPPACTGDCDGSGNVTVNELIIVVNIALGNLPLSACPIGDADGSGDITVNEIIKAVGFALTSCPTA